MQNSNQYWCYINNSEEFTYIKNLPRVGYGTRSIKDYPRFPIVFNLDLQEKGSTAFWVFDLDSRFYQFPELFPELSFEEMKAQIFIYQLTL